VIPSRALHAGMAAAPPDDLRTSVEAVCATALELETEAELLRRLVTSKGEHEAASTPPVPRPVCP
jgi:hypothetical protein